MTQIKAEIFSQFIHLIATIISFTSTEKIHSDLSFSRNIFKWMRSQWQRIYPLMFVFCTTSIWCTPHSNFSNWHSLSLIRHYPPYVFTISLTYDKIIFNELNAIPFNTNTSTRSSSTRPFSRNHHHCATSFPF